MILQQLTMTNFRVLQGQHTFDLAPRKKWNAKRPIILFGGLNGTGKTTTLTAVRLVLYGRQSLGSGTSQKAYEEYLGSCVHRARDTQLQANSSSIELTFNYAHMGVVTQYRVKRSWTVKSKSVHERLTIDHDGKEIPGLNYEQCQGFLNELIPIGVSDLFFFDGEKIAKLAEDPSGTALADAIKKLLGLDIIERLHADITVLLRNHGKAKAGKVIKKEIAQLEATLKDAEDSAEGELVEFGNSLSVWQQHKSEFDRLNNELNAGGGTWANSREQELTKQAELTNTRKQLESNLREIIADKYPFSLACTFVKHCLKQLQNEAEQKRSYITADAVGKHLAKLKKQLSSVVTKTALPKVNAVIDGELSQIMSSQSNLEIIHDISDSAMSRITAVLELAIESDQKVVKNLSNKLRKVREQLDAAGDNIARAPNEQSLAKQFESLRLKQEEINKSSAKMEVHREEAKKHLRAAMDAVRHLESLHEKHTDESDISRMEEYGHSTKALLDDFSKEAASQKVKDLETEFAKSFQRLARKEDVNMHASINPKTFKVSLIDDSGNDVNKDELSAGEKQIYAISILEALARTSGRKLPIIIDTPLGRLDSKHRTKLVKNYFPYASQQVIILSTDTEVDEKFYADLYKHMSHAYKLEYDPSTSSTFAKEGYFWKSQEAVA